MRLGQESRLAGSSSRLTGFLRLEILDLSVLRSSGRWQNTGQLPAEGLVELDVLGQRRDPLLGADDVGDPHQVVVHHVGEVVGGEAVGLEQHLVVDLGVVESRSRRAADRRRRSRRRRHREPDHVRLAGVDAVASASARVDAPAVAVVAELCLGGLLLGAELVEPLAGAEAGVGGAGRHQPFDVLASRSRCARSAGRARRGRPRPDPRPTRARAIAGRRRSSASLAAGAALAVGVLDAQHELPAVLARQGVVEQRDVGGAHVGIAGGARARCGFSPVGMVSSKKNRREGGWKSTWRRGRDSNPRSRLPRTTA